MKYRKIVLLLLICIIIRPLAADEYKTESPHFIIQEENQVESFPLLSTTADVNISGVIADVTINQIYKNSGKKPIEALYVFPASTNAAVYGMKMKIADRVITADIEEKIEAKKIYDKAREDGKSASLLEQVRPNVFRMSVANIMPGDTIRVELKYTELLVPEDGLYKFVYPAVTGPRYTNNTNKDDSTFASPGYMPANSPDPYKWNIQVQLNTGVSLKEIYSSTHKIDINKTSSNTADISISADEESPGNRDFVLDYTLRGDRIETGLIMSEGNENFFLLMLQPPKVVKSVNIVPREYIFIMDVSGSMEGFPLGLSKSIVLNLLDSLREIDKFNIIFFAGSSSSLFSESEDATQSNIAKAKDYLSKIRGGGGTELLPALEKALKVSRQKGYSRTLAVFTDGYVTVEKEAYELIKDKLGEANLFAFGIGSSVDRYIIESMAHAGMGEPFIVTGYNERKQAAEKFIKYISAPVMTDINVEIERLDAYDIEPMKIPDVFADRPIILFGKWKYPREGTITVKGLAAGHNLKVTIPLKVFTTEDTSSALKYLWARNKLKELADFNSIKGTESNKQDIIGIGMRYNLLTDYTSFVAVDNITVNNGESPALINQPLPLPKGISPGMSNITMNSTFIPSSSGSVGSYAPGPLDNPLCPVRRSLQIYPGLHASFNNTAHDIALHIPNIHDPAYTSGNGYSLGISWEQPLNRSLTPIHLIEVRLSYDQYTAHSNWPKKIAAGLINKNVSANGQYNNNFSLSFVDWDFVYNLTVFDDFELGIGLSGSFYSASAGTQKITITDDDPELKFNGRDYYEVVDNGRSMILKSGEIGGLKKFLLSYLVQIRYEIFTGGPAAIIPYIGFRRSLTDLFNNDKWKMATIYSGLTFRWAIRI